MPLFFNSLYIILALCVGVILTAFIYKIKLSLITTAPSPRLPDVIPEPLWSLMLSTNDCYPGCSCEGDKFEITHGRLGPWLDEHPAQARQVMEQISNLLACPPNRDALSQQTNYFFGSDEEAVAWLKLWQDQLQEKMQPTSIGTIEPHPANQD